MGDPALATAEYWGPLFETIADIAFAIVIVALAVELVSGRISRHFNKQVDAAREERIAAANERAAAAELRLKEFRQPRTVSAEQAAQIVQKIKPFAGTHFDVGHAVVDREQWDFLWQLEPVFPQAGWVQVDWIGGQTFRKNSWPGNHVYGVMGVNNISIEIHPQSRDRLLPAAEALAAALNEVGLNAVVSPPNNSSANVDAIHLLVGPKR